MSRQKTDTEATKPGRAAEVVKIDGAPGSGKTYQLLQHVKELREKHDLEPWRIRFLTFSRAARRDVQERLKDVFHGEDPDEVEGAVSTVHGAALGQASTDETVSVDFDEVEIITENNDADKFARFFRVNYPLIWYDTGAKDPLKAIELGEEPNGETGNDIIAAYNYLRQKCQPYEPRYIQSAPVEIDERADRVEEVMHAWDEWKDENGYLQHDDYVHEAVDAKTTPSEYVEYVFIDEFQDLSPLQYKLYKIWRDRGDVRRFYIAGDADQSIYGFRAAKPEYFERTAVDKVEPQPMSRRCPSEVVDVANSVLGDGDMEPDREGGTAKSVSATESYDLAGLVRDEVEETDGDVMILARTNSMVGKITSALRTEGVAYWGLSHAHRRWRAPARQTLRVMRRIRDDKVISRGDAATVLEEVPKPALDDDVAEAVDKDNWALVDGSGFRSEDRLDVSPEAFVSWFGGSGPFDLLNVLELKDWQKDLIRRAYKIGGETAPKDVRVGTIHSSKGLEAETVILSPAYTQKMLERYNNGQKDEEKRVFYVGASRASRRLIVLRDFFDGPTVPVFG